MISEDPGWICPICSYPLKQRWVQDREATGRTMYICIRCALVSRKPSKMLKDPLDCFQVATEEHCRSCNRQLQLIWDGWGEFSLGCPPCTNAVIERFIDYLYANLPSHEEIEAAQQRGETLIDLDQLFGFDDRASVEEPQAPPDFVVDQWLAAVEEDLQWFEQRQQLAADRGLTASEQTDLDLRRQLFRVGYNLCERHLTRLLHHPGHPPYCSKCYLEQHPLPRWDRGQ